MSEPGTHWELITLPGLLAHVDALNDLLMVLGAHTRPSPIWCVSLAPLAWDLLWMRDIDIQCASFGDSEPDEDGQVHNLDGWYVYTRDGMVQVNLEPLQSTTYRLWDRKSRELIRDRRGWYYVVSGRRDG